MISDERLSELKNLVSEGRKLTDYKDSPIQIFLEAIDELRIDLLERRERIKVLEAALHKIYTYRSDKPDWNMVMAIAGDIVNPMIAIPSKAARSGDGG